jgi:hypothetical protein
MFLLRIRRPTAMGWTLLISPTTSKNAQHDTRRRDAWASVEPAVVQTPCRSSPRECLYVRSNTADQLRSSIACAGFVSCIEFNDLVVANVVPYLER